MEQLPVLDSAPERIRHLRSMLGVSQARMAEMLEERGVPDASFGSYRRYESGSKSPSVKLVEVMADLAGVDAGWVLSTSRAGHGGTDEAQAFRDVARIVERVRPRPPSDDAGWVMGLIDGLIQLPAVQEKGDNPFCAAIGAIQAGLLERFTDEQRKIWDDLLRLSETAGHYSPDRVPIWTEDELLAISGVIQTWMERPPTFRKDTDAAVGA